MIEDTPREASLVSRLARSHRLFLALYRGCLRQNDSGTFQLPDKITIYKNSILSISRDEANVHERIKSTVLHRIGHHFGLS